MIESLIPPITEALEFGGIAAIAIGTLWSTAIAGLHLAQRRDPASVLFERYRRHLSRGILLGLELLVAADIVDTLTIEPTFTSVGVLGLIVLVRTFLSFTLEVEVTGRWPWQSPVDPPQVKH